MDCLAQMTSAPTVMKPAGFGCRHVMTSKSGSDANRPGPCKSRTGMTTENIETHEDFGELICPGCGRVWTAAGHRCPWLPGMDEDGPGGVHRHSYRVDGSCRCGQQKPS